MTLSLRESAEAVGMTKPALLKAIQRGKLSATRDNNNEWQIEPAELFRVYKPATVKEPQELTKGTGQESDKSALLTAQLEALKRENALLLDFHERERRQLKEQLEREKEQADNWRRQATALLTHQPEAKPEPTPTKSGLLNRIFRGKPPT